MRIVYTRRARDDLAGIVSFLGFRNASAALVVAETIRRRIALLGRAPFSGRSQDGGRMRKVVTVPFGYTVYHVVDEERRTVSILSICARDRPQANG